MKNYRRKPDTVQAVKYNGVAADLAREIGSAFVKEEVKPSDHTDVAVYFYNVGLHDWILVTPGDYVVRDDSGAYRLVKALPFEREYEKLNLRQEGFTPRIPGVIGTVTRGGSPEVVAING